MRKRKLTKVELEQAWQQWTMGRTTSTVARTYGVEKASLVRQWQVAGFPFRPIRRKAPPLADKKLRKLVKQTGLDQGQVMTACLLLLADQNTTPEQILARWLRAVEENEVPKPAYPERRYDFAGKWERAPYQNRMHGEK